MGSDVGIKKDDIIENLHRTITGYEFNLRGISTKITIRLDKIKKTRKVEVRDAFALNKKVSPNHTGQCLCATQESAPLKPQDNS